ncbi:MAG TPA: ACT domain-containing protein [Candidatus Solibacter sp.]|jgi:hypothetical protein|nr:ACT domain-containing protein [Candidatus Solibacter sp.]
MKFTTLPGPFAICKLDPAATIPDWAAAGVLSSLTRTPNELSIICEQANVPQDIKAERDFSCIRLEGPFDFQAIGILESFLAPLAKAGVPVFALSTYDTDWILIQEKYWKNALAVLMNTGHGMVS